MVVSVISPPPGAFPAVPLPHKNTQGVRSAAPARVWLADDSPVEAEHARTLLSRGKHRVETFTDGAGLLERLEQPGVEMPELLLLDWMMPGVSGQEVCRYVRERYGPTDLPILVLTASTHEGALEEAFAAGANDYVAKPARALELLARVRTLLQTRRDAEALRVRERDLARVLAEAQAERTRLNTILSTLEEGVMLQDAQGVLRFSNAAAERLLGLDAEQMAGRTLADPRWGAVREDGSPLPGEAHAPMRALRTGQGVTGDVVGMRHADGRLVWLSINAQPYFEQDGTTLAGVVSSFFDITARKEAEAAREVFLQALAVQPGVAVAIFRGPDLIVEMSNPLFRTLAGGGDVVGKPLLQEAPSMRGQGFDLLVARVLETGEPYIEREYPIRFDRHGDGVPHQGYFHFVCQPMHGVDGATESVLTIGQEVTEMVQARHEAERLMALEKERAGFEQQLIGIVSHDLRTPVAAIMLGAATLLRRPDVEERQRRTAERILTSAGRANRMIHDLLDFTQARLGGGLSVLRVPGDFHAIVRQVVEESQVSNPGRSLRLVQTGSGEGVWDADRLAQLVSNLLSNAVHYSPSDSPVRIETHGEENELVLTVHNTGAPISPEVVPSLFQPMQRGVAGVSDVRSVGLGLYIVDQVVRSHAGRVEVTSTTEGGTAFTVRLPRGAPVDEAPDPEPAVP